MAAGSPQAQAQRIDHLAWRLGEAPDARGVHLALHEFVAASTPMNGFFIAHHDPATRLRRCVYAHTDGVEIDATKLPVLPLNGSPNSRAIVTRRPVLVDDYEKATAGVPVTYVGSEIEPAKPRSSLAVPMVARDRVVGLLTIQSLRGDAFGPREIEVLQSAANLAALALENISLRERLEEKVAARTQELQRATDELRRHAVARDLVRRMLARLSREADVRPATLRDLGRELAARLEPRSADAAAAAYAEMGLGFLRVVSSAPGRHEFAGNDLLERAGPSTQPTCFLGLGFLEGAVGALEGAPALGAEVACQSRGHPECRFVVAPRRG